MDTGILDTMLATIAGYTTGSSGTITGYATSLYGILILLDFILAVLLNIGETDHIKQLVRKVLFYGFWIWIIREWGTLCDALLDSLMITGTAIGGVGASVLKTPSLLIDKGLAIAEPYLTYASEMSWLEITASPLNWLMVMIGYAGVVLAFAILALQIFITYVEFYIASALLLIFIPWGSFKYTSFVAEKAIGAVISYGTKLMMLGAVYGLSTGIINSMTINFNGEPEPGTVLASMLGPFALCLLCWQAPGMAAGLMTGAPTLSAGTAAGTAVAGFAGAAAGGSAGAGIGSMAMSTGSSAARAGAALAGAATAGSTAGGPGAGGAAGAMSGAAGFAASAFKSAASNATQGVRGAFASGQASVAASAAVRPEVQRAGLFPAVVEQVVLPQAVLVRQLPLPEVAVQAVQPLARHKVWVPVARQVQAVQQVGHQAVRRQLLLLLQMLRAALNQQPRKAIQVPMLSARQAIALPEEAVLKPHPHLPQERLQAAALLLIQVPQPLFKKQ